MGNQGVCEKCGGRAMLEKVHAGSAQHRFCRAHFVEYTAEYFRDHPEKAEDLAGTLQLPWPATGVVELARILVTGLERTRAEMSASFGDSGAS